jgi:hypothetical protein
MGMMDDALSWGADRLKKILSGEQVDSFEDTDEGTIVSMAENEYKRRAEEKRPFDLQMRLNIAFIEGNQYVEINPVTMALDEIPELYWWQEREVFNHIAPTIEVRQAKLSRMRPILKTRPGTGQMEDVRASKIGTQLLKNVYEDENIQEKLSVITAWTESCGSALLKSVWNSNKGSLVAQLAGENGEQVPVREGDLDTIVVPPQEIFPDSCYHQDVDDCRSIIHAKAYHIKDIEDIWGAKVAAEETVAMQMQRAMSGVGGLGYGMGGFRYGYQTERSCCGQGILGAAQQEVSGGTIDNYRRRKAPA